VINGTLFKESWVELDEEVTIPLPPSAALLLIFASLCLSVSLSVSPSPQIKGVIAKANISLLD
jgi:hypothetical protein